MDVITMIRERGGYIARKDIESRAVYDQLLTEIGRGNVLRVRQDLYGL
jgi:hypothetical protein